MEDTAVWNILSRKDQQAAFAVINQLGDCQTRKELNHTIKAALIPLMDCSGVFYARMHGDNTPQLLDQIYESSLTAHSWNSFLELATQNQLLASALFGQTHNRLATDFFCCTDECFHQVNRCCAVVAVFDAFKPTLALYFCRLNTQEHYFNVRDFNLMQLLRCAIMQTLNAILFQEECQNLHLAMDQLSGQAEPLALIRDDGIMMYKNHAFKQIVDQDNFRYLSLLLSHTRKTIPINNQHDKLIHLGRRLYKVNFKSIKDQENENQHLYLLRLARAYNKNEQIFRQWRQAGLTSRELQIAALLYQGVSTRDTSDQLNLSYHTVRNHIKHIYEKTGVSNRSELLTSIE